MVQRGTQRNIEKPHNTQKKKERRRHKKRDKVETKTKTNRGMKIREVWRTPIYSTAILYF
jgi:hypothetical protein